MNAESKTVRTGEAGRPTPASPMELLARVDLTREEKVAMLREWELDLREGMVAEDENMVAAESAGVTLGEVLDALRALGATSQFHEAGTKRG